MTRLPEPLTLFVDRSLGGKKVAAALRAAGVAVEVHDDHYPNNKPDAEWLDDVGRKGWVVLTKDERLQHRPAEFVALFEGGTAVFVLTTSDLTGDAMAKVWVSAIPAMRALVADTDIPFIARVDAKATVRLFLNDKGLEVRARGMKARLPPKSG